MITYKLGTEIDKKDIHKAFHAGFSDYIIKMDIPEDFFFKRFFGPEANTYDLAIVAYHENEPVGLVMGGIKSFDGGAKTMRCGGLCVVPDYRGKGISHELMRRHKEMALEKGCKQIMLEVIGGNNRAIQFYKNIGYQTIYQIDYYSAQKDELKAEPFRKPKIVEIAIGKLDEMRYLLNEIHMNWQNDLDYVSKLDNIHVYGITDANQLISFLVIDEKGKIFLLWTEPQNRFNGNAHALIHHAARELKLQKIIMSFPNSATMTGFALNVGFKKDALYQYEMYASL